MKILVVTQVVDVNDPVLGFFHRWIEEFAKHYECVTVICLYKGEYDLPKNVKVLSLGKESGESRIKYVLRFYTYIWEERKNYDSIFVHMNQEYVLLGGLLWRVWSKKIMLWRNHAKGNVLTRIAVLFSHNIFCTSPDSFTARFKKTTIMPVGVDITFFKVDTSVQKKQNSILFLGRISPVKNVNIFIEALKELKSKEVQFSATIAGSSSSRDTEYEKMLHDKVFEYGLSDSVTFTGAVNHKEALKLYREHALYVNITPSGSMDKTIFEALSVGLKVVVANTALIDILPPNAIVEDLNDLESLTLIIEKNLYSPYDLKAQEKISLFVSKQNLESLMREIFRIDHS